MDLSGGTATYTVILIITTLFSKVLGFAREMSLAYVYGAGAVSDAYIVAFSIPTILFSGVGTAVLTGYISQYTQLQKSNPKKLKRFSNNVTTMVFFLSLITLVGFWAFKQYIVKLFAPQFPEATLAISVNLSQMMMISVLFIGVYFIFQGYLQIHNRFLVVGLISVPLNLCVVASILLSSPETYMRLAWGVVVGYAASFLMLLVAAFRNGYTYRPQLDFRDKDLRKLIVMVIPIFLGKTITQINTMADRAIASSLPEGSVSALSYGNRITGFVTSVFVISLTTALFPQLSRLSAMKSVKRMKRTFITSVGIMSLLVIPISVGLMIFSKEIVALMFQRGAFTAADVERTAQVVFFYSLGLICFSIKEVMINVFYALQDTKTPTVNSLIAIVINVVLNLLLIRSMAHSGLALATSISGFLTMMMMMVSLRKRLGPLGLKAFFKSLAKMGLSTAGMALAVVPVYDLFFASTGSMLLSFLLAVAAGALVYGLLNILLRTKEMGMLVVGIMERLIPHKRAE